MNEPGWRPDDTTPPSAELQQPPLRVLVKRATALKLDLTHRIGRQAYERPEWIASVDARAAGLQGLLNVLRFAELSLVFVERHLSDANWWTQLRGRQPSIREITLEYTAYSQGSKFGLFHLVASSFETTIRSLLRAVAPGVANDGRAEFKRVYDSLIRAHLGFPKEDTALLDLVRLIRNTIHNEGLHRPPSSYAATVLFRGVRYEFLDSSSITFVTWEFVLDRIADLSELLDRVVRSDAIWYHPAHIPADWAEVLPRSST